MMVNKLLRRGVIVVFMGAMLAGCVATGDSGSTRSQLQNLKHQEQQPR